MKLSICIPTRNRPDWCLRALHSVSRQTLCTFDFEVLIFDNSDTDETGVQLKKQGSEEALPHLIYLKNQPPCSMVENWNLLGDAASGTHLLWLHDDDYLLPGALAAVGEALKSNRAGFHCFSVQVVDEHGTPRRRGGRHNTTCLGAQQAVLQILTHSSWIRFPGVVLEKEIFLRAGRFDPLQGDTADVDLWLRVAAIAGIQTHSKAVAAYTAHTGQATNRMFTKETLEKIYKYGDRAFESQLLDPASLLESRRVFFWRFLLAGMWKALSKKDFSEARRIASLSKSAPVVGHACPAKLIPLKFAFFTLARFF